MIITVWWRSLKTNFSGNFLQNVKVNDGLFKVLEKRRAASIGVASRMSSFHTKTIGRILDPVAQQVCKKHHIIRFSRCQNLFFCLKMVVLQVKHPILQTGSLL